MQHGSSIAGCSPAVLGELLQVQGGEHRVAGWVHGVAACRMTARKRLTTEKPPKMTMSMKNRKESGEKELISAYL